MITRIVVNKHYIKWNLTHKKKKPVISLQTSRDTVYCNAVKITNGVLRYTPAKPLKCGASVYIETHEPVEILKTHNAK